MDKPTTKQVSAEQARLDADMAAPHIWRQWGTFLSERQWGSVREDYSADGNAWDYFPHDQARSRAYRWGEDGLLGWCDRFGHLNFAIGLWNGKDPILKERLFGLTNSEGNHGEDVKELYYFLDGTPTCSYMRGLYRYPIAAYPYDDLVQTNHQRTRLEPEYELVDSQALSLGWFDVTVEYGRINPDETAIRATITNCSDKPAELDFLAQFWHRNIWSWNTENERPRITMASDQVFHTISKDYGDQFLYLNGSFEPLFTENETNNERIFQCPNSSPYVKDAFHQYIVNGNKEAVNPDRIGSKAAGRFHLSFGPQEQKVITLLLSNKSGEDSSPERLHNIIDERRSECNSFYDDHFPGLDPNLALVQKQAFAGLIWSKQHYHYNVKRWLEGDPTMPPPPPTRTRNNRWQHVRTSDVLSMPDTWEYPWFAAWDLAFQTVAFARVDPNFAKSQLVLLMREWFMHPNGQVPAYEWAFGDVNPPVHAWAAWRIYTIEKKAKGVGDRPFLERIFHKLLLNFTWWVNRKDEEGNNVFQGGFLGLDNIGVFDRNSMLPDGLTLEQSDGTSWMAMYCLRMLTIALELANEEPAYEDVAIKFFEHFLLIAEAMNGLGPDKTNLWDETDGFYYDVLKCKDHATVPVRVRSLVGLIPLYAVLILEADYAKKYPNFARHIDWVITHLPDLAKNLTSMDDVGVNQRKLLSIVDKDQLLKILQKLLDENEFLSPYGLRALSKYHLNHPYSLQIGGQTFSVDYEPGESTTGQFGGNSNWRGPIWMPTVYLIIEALQQYDYFYGNKIKVELPTGSGNWVALDRVAAELEARLISIFQFDQKGNRPVHNQVSQYSQTGPWKDEVLFYEYFHGENGRGCGASHQTGWTALIAKIIEQRYLTTYSGMD